MTQAHQIKNLGGNVTYFRNKYILPPQREELGLRFGVANVVKLKKGAAFFFWDGGNSCIMKFPDYYKKSF